MTDLDLLLQSVREIDENIKQVRQQLDELYDYRRVLVDQVVRLAQERGYERGYTNGEYRYKVTRTYRATDPQAIASIAPEIVESQVVLKVDNRQLTKLMETGLAEKLAPYVVEEISHEVVVDRRKSVKQLASIQVENEEVSR